MVFIRLAQGDQDVHVKQKNSLGRPCQNTHLYIPHWDSCCPPAHLKPGILLTLPLAHIFVSQFFLQTFFWTNPFLSSPAVPCWLELFSIHFGTTVIV